ncbi:MAG: transketolase, partial [Devosiaceae bacterium]|nr:transketolase [Devosiaceae bacterium]
NKQGTSATHGAPLGDEEIALTRKELGWKHAPFNIPRDVYEAWYSVSARGKAARLAWEKTCRTAPNSAEFFAALDGSSRNGLKEAINTCKQQLSVEAPKVATRKASQMVLEIVNATVPNMVGGSADLTGSNLTLTSGMSGVSKDNYGGNYIYYGVREHGMAAAMNGLYLHGGALPYGGTFLAFADYCRGSIRLSALMGIPVTYVMTHDSIGLGEDGPTHQPVEQVASLRAIPNLNVFRPADAVETAEVWELAVMSDTTPSVLCLSRQGLPTVRTTHSEENLTAKGAYVLREANGARQVTLIATGSEVEIAINAADILKGEGIEAAVISAPCFELFATQNAEYRKSVLGTAPRVGVEALIKQGWGELLGDNSAFIGMSGFGASAPASQLYKKFGITAQAVAQAARELIE